MDFLKKLLETPGVSGYENQVQQVVRDFATPIADDIKIDLHGNLIASINTDHAVRIMLAGHCDQIGLIISQIDETGFLFTQTVGGWDPQQLVGQRVTVWTDSKPVNGVISRKAIHLQDESERKQLTKAKELWIDIGVASMADANELVRIGDPVTLKLGMTELQDDLICGPAMDDRCGVWVVFEALRRATSLSLNCGLFSVSTVQEEIGLRGAKTAAYSVDPQIGIAVDVTHATDCPGIDRRQQGEIFVGRGPVIFRGPNVNSIIGERMIEICKTKGLDYQLAALGRAASNDSNSLQISRGGVATGLIGIPNRYMHSAVETISKKDIDIAATLLAEFVGSVKSAEEFIPV